eukprot:2709736-Pyramimonas_sp.AAC.1
MALLLLLLLLCMQLTGGYRLRPPSSLTTTAVAGRSTRSFSRYRVRSTLTAAPTDHYRRGGSFTTGARFTAVIGPGLNTL